MEYKITPRTKGNMNRLEGETKKIRLFKYDLVHIIENLRELYSLNYVNNIKDKGSNLKILFSTFSEYQVSFVIKGRYRWKVDDKISYINIKYKDEILLIQVTNFDRKIENKLDIILEFIEKRYCENPILEEKETYIANFTQKEYEKELDDKIKEKETKRHRDKIINLELFAIFLMLLTILISIISIIINCKQN